MTQVMMHGHQNVVAADPGMNHLVISNDHVTTHLVISEYLVMTPLSGVIRAPSHTQKKQL
jgi:hypothetical protein